MLLIMYILLLHMCIASLRVQTALHEVVTLRYQHHRHHGGGVVDNEVPQLHTMLSEPLY